ncbi:MAG: B12-binding domain-containing radical SAM protein [Thaumarchaeota archaeon]|nr:B12-binding domain-containing radical SAM protein [Nitrososphaerota archaeon]
MKVLLIVPEIRLDMSPQHVPFWAGILGAIVEKKGGDVGILDLNALRMNYDGNTVPSNVIVEEISSEKWDIVGIGGLTTTYKRIKQLAPLIRKCCPDSLFIGGGGWSTYNPDEILELIPELDLIVIGEGEETFSELYDNVSDNQTDFRGIAGLCLRETNELYFTAPRALIPDLNTIPYPSYDLFENEIYFKYSSIPMSVESYNAQRRFSVVWERGCPRGCTFCSHNGMSRIDLQNIYGSGDRLKGEKRVRKIDEEEGTFQLPARWPSPQYAVDNIKLLVDKYDCDFISIMDENMTSNLKWTKEFCTLYMDEGLDKILKWGTLGDAPSVATKPSIIKTMQDAGCAYISFGFESASDRVLNEDIQKGQLRSHLQTTINTLKEVGMTPITTFMIGNPNEDINDLMETVDFWIKNGAEVDPFICTPYVGSPLFYNNRDYVLEQYDERILLVNQGKFSVENRILKKMYLEALDKFMEDCGDATQYTATVSKNFTIPELIALKQFMYNHDVRRMLQMANQKYEETKLPQWKVSEKWKKYDPNHKAKKELTKIIESL